MEPMKPIFNYTLDNSKLTLEQREFYEKNSFLVVKELVDAKFLDNCKQRFVDLCDKNVPWGSLIMMDISLIKKGAVVENLFYKVQDLCMTMFCLNTADIQLSWIMLNVLLGPTLWLSIQYLSINHLILEALLPFIPYTDLHYFPFRPANRIVCSWTAMEDITPENGCLIVLPGSHTGELLQHDYPQWENGVNKMYRGVRGYDDHPIVELSMKKGDTVFFHPILIHGSGPNRTQGFRKAISTHYSCAEMKFIDIRGTSQENIAKEVVEVTKRRGPELNFQDF
ncbi:phytanoyl-CoA dioxygenase, peroxisomal-like [Daphnia pulicaria]|uniref:phytanoyl-CoA dioxygenase, peroxisomal-like n=1 Tax=Daphnia pulicaria TaxID=35523 RepID=UPI001EEB7E11|nr:phytanoyl-CoA dioxygenase, peroxisomal-like [Daphnia pulicaria]